MRVARIVQRLPPFAGGKEIHADELTEALALRGIDQTVFFRQGHPPRSATAVRSRGRRTHASAFAGWAIRSVTRAHHRRAFDLIHAHGDLAEAIAAAALGRMLDVPAVLSVHGGLSRKRTHDLARLGSFSAMQTVLAVSDGVAGDLAHIQVSAPVVVRASGVREAFFTISAVAHETPVAVALGRLAPVKGYETLIEAARLCPAISWRVIGGGDDVYAQGLRRKLVAAGVEVAEAHGATEAARMLAAADVLVLPSRDLRGQREGMPTAALEALAVGLPVVASDAAGLAALAADGAPIEIVRVADPRALVHGVRSTLSRPRPDREVTARFAKRWGDVADVVLDVYASALAGFRRPAALYATAWLELGGAEKLLLALAEDASARGWRTAVAGAPGSLVGDRPSSSEYVPLRRGNRARPILWNAVALSGATLRLRPSVVNIHHFPLGVSARLAQLLTRLPYRVVMTVHGTERPAYDIIIGLVAPLLFDRILPVAETVRQDLLRATLPTRRNRFAVVHAGTRPPEPVRVVPQTIGVVARLVERKGHRYLLQALAELAEHDLDGWRVELWGDGPLRDPLSMLATELGLDEFVSFRGSIPDAAALLGRFEIMVLPSIREGLPLMLMEAMAAGRPTIATRLPGVLELVGESGAALLVSPGDAHDLAAALRTVVVSREVRDRLAQAGAQRYRQMFTLTRMLNDYAGELRLYGPYR